MNSDKLFYSYNSTWNSKSLDYTKKYPYSIILHPETKRIIHNGVIYGNGNSGPYFVKGSGSPANGQWVGTNSQITELYEGLSIIYIPDRAGVSGGTYGGTALNINGWGFVNTYYNTSRLTTHYSANTPILFTYFSQGWRATPDYDSTDTTTMQLYYTRIKAGTGGIQQYSLAMQDGNGNWQSFTTTNGTGNSKTKNTNGFILGSRIYYMNTSSNVTNGNVCGNGVVRAYQALLDLRYTLNINNNLVGNKPVYIIGTIGSDNLFYLYTDSNNHLNWWTQDEPTQPDGLIYIKIIESVYPDSTPYRGDLISDGYAFWYKDGQFRRYDFATHAGDANFATSSNNSGSATQLTNSRLLWGQSFNGTADVKGEIKNTGNVWPQTNNESTIGTSSKYYNTGFITYTYGWSNFVKSTNITTGNTYITGVKSQDAYTYYNNDIYINNDNKFVYAPFLRINGGNSGTFDNTCKLYVSGNVEFTNYTYSRFVHKDYNSNDAVLLTNGSWKPISDFVTSFSSCGLFVGTNSNLTQNAAATNGNTYLTLKLDNTWWKHNLVGDGISIVSDANGKITFTNTAKDSHYTGGLKLGSSNTTTNDNLNSNSTWIKYIENNTLRPDKIEVKGDGLVSVSSNSGTLTIKGNESHYLCNLYIGSADFANNSATTNPYIKLYEGKSGSQTLSNEYKISGDGGTTVSSASNGNITISSLNDQVTQKIVSTNTSYNLLFKWSNNNTDETNYTHYASTLYFNPSTKVLENNGGNFKIKNVSTDNVLTSGGYKAWSISNTDNALVARNSNGDIYTRYVNSDISDETITNIGSVFVTNGSDNFIRRVSLGILFNQIDTYRHITQTVSLKVTENWMSTGITTSTGVFGFGDGTYLMQIKIDNNNALYSGILTVFNYGSGNDTEEIILHCARKSTIPRIYIRTVQGTNYADIQIAAATTFASAYNITFTFKKLI